MANNCVKSPGKSYRVGITLVELADMFPDEEAATQWFESIIWADERCCGHCGSVRTQPASHAKMPYWCSDCRSYFSVRTGTPMSHSKVPLRKWAIAIYLCLTSLKSVSSMKLHRDIGVSQPAAWYMLMRIREAWNSETASFAGPVEVDETYFGGKRKNMPKYKREQLSGRGPAGKTAVVGAKDRGTNQVSAKVVADTKAGTLQDFVTERTEDDAIVYTDDATAYNGLPRRRESVRHSAAEYVRGQAHTNGIESFWNGLSQYTSGVETGFSPVMIPVKYSTIET